MDFKKMKQQAEKVATEKVDFNRSFPSAKMANMFAWEISKLLHLPAQPIKTWKSGRYLVKCEMVNEVFDYMYDAETKMGYLSFLENNDGKTGEELREEAKLNERRGKLMPQSVYDFIDSRGAIHERSAEDIKVACKLFNPTGAGGTWYIYDYDRTEPNRLWGFACLGDPQLAECGTVWLPELAEFEGMFGVGIERDLHFPHGEISLQEVINIVKAGGHV